MKRLFLIIIFLVLAFMSIILFFKQIDALLEIDDLKQQIKLQKDELNFVIKIANGIVGTCKMSVSDLEKVVSENGRIITWQGASALVSGFKVQREGNCVVEIRPGS